MRRFLRHLMENASRRIFGEIPKEFHSVETGRAFDTCIDCEMPLSGFYIVEKAFVNGDALYEYALCEKCMESLSEDLSAESKQYIRRFLGLRLFRGGIDCCRKCRAPREPGSEHLICGAFHDDQMFCLGAPVCLCHGCIDALMEGMSKQTRDRLDDFDREHFPGPPEMELDLPRPRRPVLI